jgi:uncharacterized repeat protein (TIGR02543 family)
MRAQRRPIQAILSRLLVALLIVAGFQATDFIDTPPAQAADLPGSINLANASNGNSSLTTTLAESPGTGDLTYEFWYKQVDDSSNQVIFSTQSTPNSDDGFEFRKNYGNIEVWSGGNYLGGSGIDYMNLNAWNHFVIMRVGPSNWIIYRNGDCRAYFQLSTTTSTKLTLGSTDESSFRGKIANFRYAKSALYTDPKFANFLKNEPRFTPPLTPHSATPETKVLLNTVQGANFAVDTSATPNTFTLSAAYPPTSSTETPLPIFAKFEPNGGSGSMANQVSSVTANLSTNSFTKSGSTFYGWNTESNGTGTFYKNGASYAFTSSITLHAQWSSDSVPVNFDTDGGSFVAGSSVSIGSAIPAAPTPPTKSGYEFGGWKATVGGSAVTFPYYPILTRTNAASVTSASLVDGGRYVNKGLWSSTTSYAPNSGTSPASTRDFVTYTDGLKYVAVRTGTNKLAGSPPTLDGYYIVPLDTSTTLTAIWTAVPQTVTYDLAGGSGSAPTASVQPGASFTTAAAPTKSGYSFTVWRSGASDTPASTSFTANRSYTMGSTDITLTAQWALSNNTVTFNSQNWISSTTTSTLTGSSSTLPTAPTWYGYNFKGWSETSSGAVVDVSTVTISGAKTFYAIWEQKSLAGLTGLSSPDVINAHATQDRTITSGLGDTSTSVKVPAGALPTTFQVKVYTLPDDSFADEKLGAGTYIISQVVAWADTAAGSVGNIQDTASGKPIEMTITSPDIKSGAKVYSVLGNSSTLLRTATQNGSVTVTFSEDPVIIVEAAPVVTSAPADHLLTR